MLAVNLTGVFHCCRAVVAHMTANRQGRIINVASIAGKEGVPGIAAMVAWNAGPECSFTTGFVFDLSGGRADY